MMDRSSQNLDNLRKQIFDIPDNEMRIGVA